tara:strand:+ start:2423 stop:3064 length:642 start_codon:yes stop_codon:yes gene_type:complete
MKYINFKFLSLWLKYSISNYSRYKYLFKFIVDVKPKSILEIGVYKGKRSIEMIDLAQCFNKKIKFYGFDLFEKITKKKIKSELSKQPSSKYEILKKLNNLFPKSKIKLVKGNTVTTLKKFKFKSKVDFIFIDGGHSVRTIKKDWQNVKNLINKKSVVIFDDYYSSDQISKKFGSKSIINNLEKKYISKVLPSRDIINFKNKKMINSLVLVKVR